MTRVNRANLVARSTRRLASLCLIAVLGCSTTPIRLPEPVAKASLRHPPAGSVLGTKGLYGGFAWRGIPYAAPPIGSRRFRAPVPAATWQGVREAIAFGSICPQYASSTNGDGSVSEGELVGNEDCLFLNVYAPEQVRAIATPDQSGLPVMLWFHGGGNTSGTASFYNGSRLASENQVIVVTLNYRLGFLGWFRHRSLRRGADSIEA